MNKNFMKNSLLFITITYKTLHTSKVLIEVKIIFYNDEQVTSYVVYKNIYIYFIN